VGGVTPSGWPETAPETPAARGMAAQELRAHVEAAGGFGNAMAAWGLKRASLARYLSGESPVPAELVKKLCQEL